MDVFPTLYTNKLILRKISTEDVPNLVKYANNKKISDRIINIPYPYHEPNAVFRIRYVVQGYKNKSRYIFSIVLKESQEFIGEISLHLHPDKTKAELGYWIGEPFWNLGFISEAISEVLEYGFFKLELLTIFATCHEDNNASIRVLEKNGINKKNVNGKVYLFEKNR